MAMMRAILAEQAGPPESLKLVERPVPTPGPGQALIKVAYSALNPLDTHARADRIKWSHPGVPFVPGYEDCGRVEAVGEGVDPALVGKRVASAGEWGGNADYAVATAARLVHIPDAFNWLVGATFSTCAPTSWHLIHSAGRVQAGDWVLLHSAAGAVGALTTQIAKSAGAKVIGLVGGADKVAYAKQFGADHLIDYRNEDWVARVKEITGGRGVDLIIDGNQGPDAPKNYQALAPCGNVIYLGAMAGPAPEVAIPMVIGKSISVSGFVQYFWQAKTKFAEMREIVPKLASGEWKIP
ncbi:MAG: zinc-binding dehydrogenase, partial [Gammaproteobacteria bacterium]|nr:zinc-binding dehydrogenase [Gammaproteobacteria bacterium]